MLTEYLSWRWALYVNTPLALAAAVGAVFVLTESRGRERGRVDVLGAVLITAGLVALVYGFSMATTHGWTAPLTAGMLVTGVALLLMFVLTQARMPDPLLPLRIVAHRSRGGAYLAFGLVMIGMFGMFLLVSFYLQTVAGYTALRTGVAFLPFAAAVLLASTLVGRVMTRLRSGLPLAAGVLLAAAGMDWLTQLGIDSGYTGDVLPALVLVGLGLGTMSPVAANLATFGVAERETGVASAVFNASEQVGASVGVAVLNTLAATSTAAYLAAHPQSHGTELAGVVHGYTVATAWAAGILAVGAVVVLILVNARLDMRTEPTARARRRTNVQLPDDERLDIDSLISSSEGALS
ncbi:MFS transporter [Actinophytocola sp.]|uniref:MFS transporter n=1 Tax=Actinophytocola sp. TaxID=1872138 RepID=UPI0025B9AB67|nr:MFS transporter [Actinophytocola sp.]